MATHSSFLVWEIPWTKEPGQATVHGVSQSRTGLSNEHMRNTRSDLGFEEKLLGLPKGEDLESTQEFLELERTSQTRFLSLGTIDILGQIIFWCGAGGAWPGVGLCVAGCSVASWSQPTRFR